MKILVTGGTGFVGRHLIPQLVKTNHEVWVVTRNGKSARMFLPESKGFFQSLNEAWQSLPEIDAVIALAGESVAGARWTPDRKRLLWKSRIHPARELNQLIENSKKKPSVTISASAVGFYGAQGSRREAFSEIAPPGTDFLAQLCSEWEAHSLIPFQECRRIALRFGLILGRDGGVLRSLIPIYKCGLGGRVGNGQQWMSWIHVADVIQMILWILESKTKNPDSTSPVQGALNCVAPEPVINLDFSRALATRLRRPAFVRVPATLLRAALGEAGQLMLEGQRVSSQRVQELGFQFQFPILEKALEDLC